MISASDSISVTIPRLENLLPTSQLDTSALLIVRPLPRVVPVVREADHTHATKDSLVFGLLPMHTDGYSISPNAVVESQLFADYAGKCKVADTAVLLADIQVVAVTETSPKPEFAARERGATLFASDLSWIFSLTVLLLILFAVLLLSPLLLLLILVGSVRLKAGQYLNTLLTFVKPAREIDNALTSLTMQNRRPCTMLFVTFLLSSSLVAYEIFVSQSYNILPLSGIELFGVLFLAGFAMFFARILTQMFIAYVFGLIPQMQYAIKCMFLASNIMGVLLIPIAFFFPFADAGLYQLLFRFSLIIFISVYLWQLFKSVASFLRDYISIVYFILYFCAVEIMPIILLYVAIKRL